MAHITEIKINVQANDLLEQKRKQELIQNIAELPMDILEKLNELRTEKAINALRNKWGMIKMFT